MLKYLLIIMLGAAVVRFLNNMARLGRGGSTPLRSDTEDADYEILPDDPDPPAD
ncbi:hypothetical protein ACFL6T_04440 [Candidatus Zixiibacteriota bacterium]